MKRPMKYKIYLYQHGSQSCIWWTEDAPDVTHRPNGSAVIQTKDFTMVVDSGSSFAVHKLSDEQSAEYEKQQQSQKAST